VSIKGRLQTSYRIIYQFYSAPITIHNITFAVRVHVKDGHLRTQ